MRLITIVAKFVRYPQYAILLLLLWVVAIFIHLTSIRWVLPDRIIQRRDCSQSSDTNHTVCRWSSGQLKDTVESTRPPTPLGLNFWYEMKDDPKVYFSGSRGSSGKISTLCFIPGGLWRDESQSCSCKPGWWGEYCSYPEAIRKDLVITWRTITPRATPRRIIHAVPFTNEFELTEVRLRELGDVVDLFMFGESNYSARGDPKPQRLLAALDEGFMVKYQHKMLYVFLDRFDAKGLKDGWVAEALNRNHLGENGLKWKLAAGRLDDLYIGMDADEIPKSEMLMFLKNHDGFPEPFGFTANWHVYGFYWKMPMLTTLFGGCTLDMVRRVFEYKVYDLRNPNKMVKTEEYRARLRAYGRTSLTNTVGVWVMGGGRLKVVDTKNGTWKGKGGVAWHCSYCMLPSEIIVKLISAQKNDTPRWGNYPEKLNMAYIRSLIVRGYDFAETHTMRKSTIAVGDIPKCILEHKDRFLHLLDRSVYGEPTRTNPIKKSLTKKGKEKKH